MNRFRSITINVACLTLAIVLITMRPAHAYLDPGTGSYVFQIGLAMLCGVAFTVKACWGRITASLRKFFSAKATRHDQ
jgi:hypothetical protein